MSKNFAAPELLADEDIIRHTEKTDIYAFGCLYYEVRNPSVEQQHVLMCTDPFQFSAIWKEFFLCSSTGQGREPSAPDA